MAESEPYLLSEMIDTVIDLSHWQAAVDFAAVKQAGITAVILKASQGSSLIDPTFAGRAAAAIAAGLLVGAYHFFDPSDPIDQADHFLAVAGFLPMLALDLEPVPTSQSWTSKAAMAAVRILERKCVWPVIYTGRFEIPAADPILSRCPLWLAEWGSRPICPPGWARWKLWQYTDGNAGIAPQPVPGIGRCDRSRFAGSTAELSSWWTNSSS